MAKIYPFPITRRAREPRDRNVVFHCSYCDAELATDFSMWHSALEQMQREGWRRFKEGGEWRTTCGDHARGHNAALIDMDLCLHYVTKAAIRVSQDGDATKAVWLPRSQIEHVDKGGSVVAVTMPEWLAKEKGLA